MKNSGFTLVELLAVIVILAVLALIATPVVLSIIDDAKESAMLRSAEMYLSGVENAVMRENMNSGGNFRPNECSITNGNMTCGSTNVEVEVDGEVPSTGSITFENGKITQVTLNYESGTIVKDASGNLVYEGSESTKTLDTICTHDTTNGIAEKTAGAKYSCEVKEGTSYDFYVLTTPAEGDTTINLIMDRNIYYDSSTGKSNQTTEVNTGKVAWMSDSDYGCGSDGDYCAQSNKGPVTAMTYLYNATRDWENVNPINFTYKDKEVQGKTVTGYTSFVSTNGVAVITSMDGATTTTIGTIDTPLRARMPIITEVAKSNGTNEYLYENLTRNVCPSEPDEEYTWYGNGIQPTNNIDGIIGYWTLSTDINDYTPYILYVRADGNVTNLGGQPYLDGTSCNDEYGSFGVRPVITLKL